MLSNRTRRAAAFLATISVAAIAVATPATAGIEEAVKALQAGDVPAAEKELQTLAKERDPRALFLLGLYIYGNPESKMFDLNKAAPLLLDASQRGYTPAMIPLAGAMVMLQGFAEIVRCVVCLKTGAWPSRLKDVTEIDVVEEQLAHSQFVDEEARKAAIEHAKDIDELARQRGMGGERHT